MSAAAASSQPLTSDQLEEIREAFRLFDTDDSGTIDSDGEGGWRSKKEIRSIDVAQANSIPSILHKPRVLTSSLPNFPLRVPVP